jgi:hypothetical protein
MTSDSQIVDMIERANDARPFCTCGWHTTPVWRDGTVWLECASLSQPREGRLARLLGAATARVHVHERIVDVPSAPARRVFVGQS